MTSYVLDDWFWAMFESTWIWPNFTFGQLCIWIGANNDQLLLHMGLISDSGQCSNQLELDLISRLVNFSCGLGQIMTRYVFLWSRWEWFWTMFEPTWTWPNFTFGQLFMWIGANNDPIIWLSNCYISDSE